MTESSAPTPRRSFLTRLALLTAPLAGASLAAQTRQDATPPQSSATDDEWLRKLKGKHRTVLDVEQHRNGNALGQAASMLDAWRRDYRLEPPEVNLVLGVRGTGLPIVFSDALWARFRLGEQYEIARPRTATPYDVNPFSAANVQPGGPVTAEQTVERLQQRGALFLVCRNTIAAASRRLSAAGFGAADTVQQAIVGGVLPGVVVVPAMLISFTQLQERGVAYAYVG